MKQLTFMFAVLLMLAGLSDPARAQGRASYDEGFAAGQAEGISDARRDRGWSPNPDSSRGENFHSGYRDGYRDGYRSFREGTPGGRGFRGAGRQDVVIRGAGTAVVLDRAPGATVVLDRSATVQAAGAFGGSAQLTLRNTTRSSLRVSGIRDGRSGQQETEFGRVAPGASITFSVRGGRWTIVGRGRNGQRFATETNIDRGGSHTVAF